MAEMYASIAKSHASKRACKQIWQIWNSKKNKFCGEHTCHEHVCFCFQIVGIENGAAKVFCDDLLNKSKAMLKYIICVVLVHNNKKTTCKASRTQTSLQ